MQVLLTIFLNVFCFQADSLINVINNQDRMVIQVNEMLPDNGYSLSQILSDSTLQFRKTSQFKTDTTGKYWIRLQLQNPSAHSQEFYLWAYPNVSNLVHEFDPDKGQWISHQSGYYTPSGIINVGYVPLKLPSNTTATIYIEGDASRLGKYDYTVQPRMTLWKKEVIESRTNYVMDAWKVTMGIILVLLLYNGYVYLFFRDSTYLYYLILLIGATLYVTGINNVLNILWPLPSTTVFLSSGGGLYFFGYSAIMLHLGLILIMVGFVQMTRAYLRTKIIVPVYDKLLKYLLGVTFFFLLLNIVLSSTGWYYVDHVVTPYINIMIMITLIMLIWVGIVVYRKSFKPARYYLIAHTVPLVFIIAMAFYFLYYRNNGEGISVMSNIITVMQALTFAIALVARMQLLKSELSEKTLALNLERLENERLTDKLDYNQREMASSALYQSQRNKLLVGLKTRMDGLTSILEGEAQAEARKIKSVINNSISLESDWEKFKLHFEQVHPNFFEELKASYPNLTQNEIRLSAYFHINLSVKEIATLMNIVPESVRKAKTRLNKKIKEKEGLSLSK